MDTAPTTVAQDLMVLLTYGDKGTVQQLCPADTTVAQDLMVLLRYGDKGTVQQLCPPEDHGYRSHYRGAGPHGPTQVRG
jgi:hypothetical protein